MYFGADADGRRSSAREQLRHEPFGDGPGAKMLERDRGVRVDARRGRRARPHPSWRWTPCEGGTLLEADNGVFWIGRDAHARGRRPRRRRSPLWEQTHGPGAPQRLAVLAPVGARLWRGCLKLRARRARRGGGVAARATLAMSRRPAGSTSRRPRSYAYGFLAASYARDGRHRGGAAPRSTACRSPEGDFAARHELSLAAR